MNIITSSRLALALVAVALAPAVMAQGSAASYPTKPIRLVVPFAPAGPTDIAARIVGQKLSEALGQPVVIENKPGAGGTVGSADVARAPADGYTLLYGSSSTLAVSPSLYPKLSYDAATAFVPVGLVARGPQILVISSALPVSNFAQFVEYAKKNPDAMSFSSPGNGSIGHLACELLIKTLGIKAVHVPYKGGAPALNAVAANDTQFSVDAVGTTAGLIKTGKMKAIAVLSDKRTNFAPELPTISEGGYPPVIADFWSGIVAPAGTPKAIVDKLNKEILAILKKPEVVSQLQTLGSEPQGSAPAEFASLIREESSRWAEVVRYSGAKAE